MELQGIECLGCGSTNVEFQPSSRKIICKQCGREEYYSRATLNKNSKVILAKDNAIKFFMNGDLETSQHYAREVLNLFIDNAPALYIINYYDEIKNAKNSCIKNFFSSIINNSDLALEFDEIRDLQTLFIASARILSDYEKEIIEISAANMQAEDDRKELGEFIDKICPYFIKNRFSLDFLNTEMVSYYKELAAQLDIPKTCFALIKSIVENPDSPYVGNTFYLKSKTQYFYNNFVLIVGDIINNMVESKYKPKLRAAYEQQLAAFKKNAGY